MIIRYFDAHCHIQFDQYDTDRDELVLRMKERGVAGIVVGVDLESSRKAVELAEQHEHLFASVGRHPNHDEPFAKEAFRELAKHPKVVAIGECGLDYYRPLEVNDVVKKTQQDILRKHIALADEVDKPLIIHSRPSKGTQDAYKDLIEILKEAGAQVRGDIHFFVGGVSEMQKLTALGFTVSFTAVVTFARDYDEVIRATPAESILSETDAPYVAPLLRRGERNDPLAVEDVAAKLAEIRGEDLEITRKNLLKNASNLFKLPGLEVV